jgi:DNA (cytosine-5)-methyltransferase 1
MTAATLFSGIGAPEMAMPEWRWLWHAEIEKFPAAVMRERHPASVNLGDVTAEDFVERAIAIGRPDVLVFGSPCQSYSVAGKRLGLDDPRGNLALVALGIAARLEPTWFVFENVPGLLSSGDGRDFGLFLRTVDELGYHLCWTHLDAQYAGVAQRRVRLFAVGHARDWRGPAAVLLEPESLCGHPPAREEAGESAAPTIGAGPSSGGRTYGTCPDTVLGLVPERAHALTTSNQRIDYETETLVAFSHFKTDISAGAQAPTLGAHHGGGAGGCAVAFTNQWGDAADVFSTVKADCNGALPMVAFSVALRGREGGGTAELGGDTATALRASQGGGDKPHVLTSAVRRLTPRECERLQGFPDDYTLVTYRGKPAADGPRYKAIGNSMAVPVVRWILGRINWIEQHMPAEVEEVA